MNTQVHSKSPIHDLTVIIPLIPTPGSSPISSVNLLGHSRSPEQTVREGVMCRLTRHTIFNRIENNSSASFQTVRGVSLASLS